MPDTNGSQAVATSTGDLVGKWFHTTKTCTCPCAARVAVWQGEILSQPAPDILLIQLYEWVGGEPSGQEFITLTDFIAYRPVLYDTNQDMRFSYRHGKLAHTERCDD